MKIELIFINLLIVLFISSYSHLIENIDWVGVTATSDNHFNVTINFILSYILFYPNNKLIVFDMNLNSQNLIYLNIILVVIKSYFKKRNYKGSINYIKFNFSKYPTHFTIQNYTWKQIMIYDSLIRNKKMIFWFDGGVEITSTLNYEIRIATENGMYIEPSIYPINIFLPSVVSKYFNINKSSLINYKTINIALLAVKYSKDILNDIIKPWADCAYNPSCICPYGVSRKNYRYDQTTLFLILFKSKKYKYLVNPVILNEKSHKKQCDHRKDCNIYYKLKKVVE